MCECIKTTFVTAGWLCHVETCREYNGMQRVHCKGCGGERCNPLKPSDTGEHFESYEEAYKDDPSMLARINEALAAADKVAGR